MSKEFLNQQNAKNKKKHNLYSFNLLTWHIGTIVFGHPCHKSERKKKKSCLSFGSLCTWLL